MLHYHFIFSFVMGRGCVSKHAMPILAKCSIFQNIYRENALSFFFQNVAPFIQDTNEEQYYVITCLYVLCLKSYALFEKS
jgi:hypothetical protein